MLPQCDIDRAHGLLRMCACSRDVARGAQQDRDVPGRLHTREEEERTEATNTGEKRRQAGGENARDQAGQDEPASGGKSLEPGRASKGTTVGLEGVSRANVMRSPYLLVQPLGNGRQDGLELVRGVVAGRRRQALQLPADVRHLACRVLLHGRQLLPDAVHKDLAAAPAQCRRGT